MGSAVRIASRYLMTVQVRPRRDTVERLEQVGNRTWFISHHRQATGAPDNYDRRHTGIVMRFR
ncbi:hypothetical protein F01_260306 [Burkholderia cenocepacia]|nr:hypothetical protein F01_260306 [Burkholderia cenocepacia]